MFIVDANRVKDGHEKVLEELEEMVRRHGGEVVQSIKWDERRLSYEIAKVKRGAFFLVHFTASGETVGRMERQCRIGELVLRVLITVDEDGVETQTGSPRERAEAATRPASGDTEATPAPAGAQRESGGEA
jgi:ribosomal protein S6